MTVSRVLLYWDCRPQQPERVVRAQVLGGIDHQIATLDSLAVACLADLMAIGRECCRGHLAVLNADTDERGPGCRR